MKIAVLTCGMLPVPAVQGGAVENLIDFYLEYNNQKKLHDITVYSPWDAKAETHPALSSDVNHYIFIDVTSLKARIARRLYGVLHHNEYYNYFIEYYFEQIYQNLRHISYDYIILENCPGYAYKLSQRGHKNLVLHLHNDLLNSKSRYHNYIFNSLTKIITVSDYVKNKVATIGPYDKIHTVHNGICLNNFIQKVSPVVTRQSLGFSDEDFLLVFSGRINKDKGISELIDAMLLLHPYPHIKLMVLGSSFFADAVHEDSFMHSLKKKSFPAKERITFTGFISYNQIFDYLQMADIAVLPSMWDEPFGMTCIEAMAAGLPLITTRSGGIPEICEGVATIVERDNIVNNIVRAICDLYNNPEKRQQMSKASLERAKFFDKEKFANIFFTSLENKDHIHTTDK